MLIMKARKCGLLHNCMGNLVKRTELVTYAHRRSIELSSDDISFIYSKLQGYDYRTRNSALNRYFEEWTKAMKNPGSSHPQNAGRYAANTWLREYTSRKDL